MTDKQEFLLWFIQTTPLTIIGCWAIYKYVKMNEEVKKAIVREKLNNGK